MVVIDATILLLMLRPGAPAPSGPDGAAISQPKERIEYLVQQLDKAKTKIIIPTPALSEALVRAGAAATAQMIEQIQKFAVFSIEPFDTRAAIEVAAMSREAIAKGRKRGTSDATWAKVKYDRQIVAIAKVNGATTIYSDDGDIEAIARRAKINVVNLVQLPLPPEKRQFDMLDQLANTPLETGTSSVEDEGPHPQG